MEGTRFRWGGRTSNPVRAARRSFVGSTPTLFRQPSSDNIQRCPETQQQIHHRRFSHHRRSRWARLGMLRPGYSGGWQWSRNGDVIASIRMRAERDRMIPTYRHRSGDSDWKDEEYPMLIARPPCRLGASCPWFHARRVAVGAEWHSSAGARSSPAVAAISSLTQAAARMPTIGPRGELTD